LSLPNSKERSGNKSDTPRFLCNCPYHPFSPIPTLPPSPVTPFPVTTRSAMSSSIPVPRPKPCRHFTPPLHSFPVTTRRLCPALSLSPGPSPVATSLPPPHSFPVTTRSAMSSSIPAPRPKPCRHFTLHSPLPTLYNYPQQVFTLLSPPLSSLLLLPDMR
jgi:hypothetical protein